MLITAVLSVSALCADADNVCLFEDDAEEVKDYYRENDSKDWFTFSGNTMFFNDGSRIVYSTQIKDSLMYPKMKYRLRRSENENGKCYSVSYNKDYDTNITDSNTDRPYISYRKPNDVLLADYDKTILETVLCSDKAGGRISANITSLKPNNEENSIFYNIVTFFENGTIYAGGKFLGKWNKNENYKVTLVFMKGSGNVDIYINGYPAGMGYRLINGAVMRDINKIYWYADFINGTDGEVRFDDIKLYSGEMPEILPFGKVNLIGADSLLVPHNMSGSELLDAVGGNSTLSEVGQDSVLTVSDGIFSRKYKINTAYDDDTLGSVLINADFNNENNYYSGISMVNKGNTSVIKQRGVNDAYVEITKNNMSDCHIDANITKNINEFVMETDFMFKAFGTETDIFRIRDTTTDLGGYVPSSALITVSSDGVLTASGTSVSMQLDKNKWYHAAVKVNILTKKADLYINNVKTAGDYTYTQYDMKTVTVVRMWLKANYDSGSVCFDNISVYEAKAPCDISKIPYKTVFPKDDETVSYINGKIMFHTRRGIVSKYGDISELKYTVSENDEIYVESSELERIFGIKTDKKTVGLLDFLSANNIAYYNDNRGLIVTDGNESDKEIIYKADDYLFFERPQADEIEKIFAERSPQHPRLIATQERFEAVKNNASVKKYVDNIIKNADGYIDIEPVKYEKEDGLRILKISREVLARMENFGFAYRMTGDEKYTARAWKEFLAVGDFPDWNEGHIIDVGEMLAAAAIGYDWMYDGFNESQRKYIEEIMVKKGMRYIRDAYYGKLTASSINNASKFVMWESNFNAVTNSAAVLSALAIADKQPEISFDIMEKALRSSEYTMHALAPDGGWNEGVMYWAYTMRYFTKFISALENSLGTDFGIMKYQGADKMAQWAFYLDTPNGFNAFHDSVKDHVTPYIYSFFANETNRNEFYDMRQYAFEQYNKGYGIYDLLWLDRYNGNGELNISRDLYTKGIESISVRGDWNSKDGMYFSAHAGPTECYHGHADCGTFVFDIGGESWIFDLGKEHDDISGSPYRKRTEGHNTICVNGENQNSEAVVSVEEYNFSQNCGYAVYDMTSAYSGYADSVKRGFAVDDGRRSLVVRDEINSTGENDIYCFMHTDAEITINGDEAILSKNGKQLRVQFNVDAPSYEIYVADAVQINPELVVSTQDPNTGIRKIAVKMSGTGKMVCEAKLSMQKEQLSAPNNLPLDEWREYYDRFDYLIGDGEKNNDNSCLVTVKNKFSDNNSKLIFCEYDSEGKLVNTHITDVNIKKGDSVRFNQTISNRENEVRVFIFDDLNSIVPRAEVCKIIN